MSKFHFYTDTDVLTPQVSGETFGPLAAAGGKDRFRVLNLHTSSGTPKAYALCKGLVCVQEVNASTVNIILKPEEQPGINFMPIRFIIYKGIKKSSLISGGEIVAGGNDLVESIHLSQTAINESVDIANDDPPGTTTVGPSEKVLGIDLNATVSGFEDTKAIAQLFYRDMDTFQFPSVKSGWHIGDFDPTQFGMEIITDAIGYEPTLEITRSIDHIIEVDSLVGGETDAALFDHWHQKEEILNYVDVCAFYGLFYKEGVRAKAVADMAFTKIKKEDLYDQILANFLNQNRTYLDIRDEYYNSFNYYKNYGEEIEIAYEAAGVMSTKNFYDSMWPLLTIENTDFPSGNTSDKNVIKITLPQGDNGNPLLFFTSGFKNSVINPFKNLKNRKRFEELNYPLGLSYTNEVEIANPNRSGGPGTTNFSTYVCLRYFRQFPSPTETALPLVGKTIPQNSFYDNLFLPLDMQILFDTVSGIRTRIYEQGVYVDHTDLGVDYTATVGMSEDDYNITFFAFPKERRKRFARVNKGIGLSSEVYNSSAHFLEHIQNRFPDRKLKQGVLKLDAGDVDYIRYADSGSGIFDRFTRLNMDELIIFLLDKPSLTTISSLVTANNIITDYKIFLGIRNRLTLTDNKDTAYTVFEYVIRGLVDNSGTIEAIEVPTNIKSYNYGN